MPWFAIRTVYHFGTKADGTNVFEERVACFEAASPQEAHDKAHVESVKYGKEADVEAHLVQEGYELDEGVLIEGHEVWSELFEARQTLEEFYAARYSAYEYTPDPYPPETED